MRSHFRRHTSARAAQPVQRRPQAILRVAALVASVVFGLAAIPTTTVAQSPSIEVTGGTTATVPDAYASGTYSSITVSGTGAAGERSTLTVNQPLVLDGGYQALSVTTGGLLEINANVTTTLRYSDAQVRDGGTLSLLSGTLSVQNLSLSGSGAFQRSGGSYAIDSYLSLSDGAAADFDPGDMVGSGSSGGTVEVWSGATFTLNRHLGTGTAPATLSLTGPGSSLVRSTGAETITGGVFIEDGANLSLIDGDSISAASAGKLFWSGSTAPASSTLSLAPGTTSLDLVYLGIGIGGSIAGLDSIPYTVAVLDIAGQRVEYRSGTITDSISTSAFISDSGTLALQQNLTLSGSDAVLYLRGPESSLERNGHAVSTPAVAVVEGASLTLDADLSVGRSIALNHYSSDAPTELTLTNSIVLAASDGVPAQFSLSGTGARIVRGPGVAITATAAEVTILNSGSFTMQAGDDFTGSEVSVGNGGIASNAGAQTFKSLSVSNRNYETAAPSTFTANAPLMITGSVASGNNLTVTDGGRFEGAADVTVDDAWVAWDGALALLSGTFTVTDTLTVTGSGAVVTVARGAGAAYDVAQLVLSDRAAMDFAAATDRVGILSLSSGATFTTGTTGEGLALTNLFIFASGSGESPTQLRLGSFNGTGGPGEWGLQTPDTLYEVLQGWITNGSIVSLSGAPLTVTQQDGFAYVMSVPEPATLAMLAGGIAAGAAVAIRRRPRRRRPAGA